MPSLTPSHIIEYLFCPRYTYFEYVLRIPQFEEKYYKVQRGRNLHDLKLERNKAYLRKRIGATCKWQNQYLTNDHLRGVVDEVLELEDGTMAPLDYKFASYNDRVYETYKQQLFCYAVLTEENFSKPVHKGFLVYTRSKNKLVEIRVKPEDKNLIRESIRSVLALIEDNNYPRATRYKRRCLNCTYRNICVK